jgi:hypothetical protein
MWCFVDALSGMVDVDLLLLLLLDALRRLHEASRVGSRQVALIKEHEPKIANGLVEALFNLLLRIMV